MARRISSRVRRFLSLMRPAVNRDTQIPEHLLGMRKISLDPPASRGAAICRADQKLALLGKNVLPHGYVRRIDHPIAAVEAACRLVESLSATTCIRCQAPAVSGGAYVD